MLLNMLKCRETRGVQSFGAKSGAKNQTESPDSFERAKICLWDLNTFGDSAVSSLSTRILVGSVNFLVHLGLKFVINVIKCQQDGNV